MITKEKCKILKEIQELQKKKKPIPLCLLQKLAKCQPPLAAAPIYGPYLQLVTDTLYQPGQAPLFSNFIFNIQYYNQGGYYTTYERLFTDLTGGPYQMPQSASVSAINKYFTSKYGNTVPQEVTDSIVVGKILTENAGNNSYVDLNTLNGYFKKAQDAGIKWGGYMFWSAGFKNASYPTTNLVTGTFGDINAKYRSIYIGSGNTGACFTAEGETIYAWGSDPNGTQANTILTSYAKAGFNVLILSFWNPSGNSDWVTDWTSIPKAKRQEIISNLRANYPGVKVLVSGGGANGAVGPTYGSGTDWGNAIAQYAKDYDLDGVDLDLEGSLLGTWWSDANYQWLTDAVKAIAQTGGKDMFVSFAPVGPLMVNPSS